ncbi:metal-dependent transcriptional regulator [Methanoculleus bourgensis]|jgi:DtxR family Mn-dependent transcriptional regulator|uniref:Iron dependent repressor n=3 Tax=Methanoculleus bourgensis TaxID=83986 RepID=A0A0X3BK62_9EURY|nr:metal-dependent transcriptional regulator [Methanoculleus bourgensis]MBT0732974.1 metal-dependent transcriptional regulator [Methanoculleus bourgensis]MDD3373037.1 metal-dependent transcriptional regulator [Methanoculleus bourgensis]NMA88525.1 metal-dependent transcriptional regulator [Methanoculleus bourgensis]NQS78483.1 metal-dependent transcriptional regulator [Methanoculleus bourgensis]CVK32353.1 Iron dependent repressor [Methanoculleus bourgensis]
MQGITGSELSPRKAEYLKYIYMRGDVVKTTDIAAHFSVAPSTVTKALADIAKAGYLEHSPYHGVRLTAPGTDYARFLFRRHRIVALVLSRYGLEPDEACREAKKIEQCISRDLTNRICTSLGHPMMSVCGEIEHDHSCCCPPENRKR